mmetsp:Transcript_20068/g.42151  ORF Transcript_20068/g.42151 Transcript_20068/m.42151 type:complete len:114 (-) Transcript_20068:635-976(-)
MCIAQFGVFFDDWSQYGRVVFDSDVGHSFLLRVCLSTTLREDFSLVQASWGWGNNSKTTGHFERAHSLDGCAFHCRGSDNTFDIYFCGSQQEGGDARIRRIECDSSCRLRPRH